MTMAKHTSASDIVANNHDLISDKHLWKGSKIYYITTLWGYVAHFDDTIGPYWDDNN